MTHEKDLEVANYLAKNRTELGVERGNCPEIWRFDVSLLPHNDIFDQEFWNAVGDEPYVNIAYRFDDKHWVTTL
jgi:hypothetical protein